MCRSRVDLDESAAHAENLVAAAPGMMWYF